MKKISCLIAFFTAGLVAGTTTIPAAWGQDAPPTCNLQQYGMCCSVELSATNPVSASPSFDSGNMVDFVTFHNRQESDCIVSYAGEMQTKGRIKAGAVMGTWLGGNFTLRYEGEATGKGGCKLDIYRMNIASRYMFEEIPACTNGKFD